MSKQLRTALLLKASAIALVFSVSLLASSSRSFVSTTGSDTNTASNCSATANCRSFTAALSVTNPGGEIVVLSSGGYGPATITQSVVITAIGVDAAISQTNAEQNALNINTSGNVTLVGLNLHGEGIGTYGLNVPQVAFLRLYNLTIENFTGDGINLGSSNAHLDLYDSRINDNIVNGLELSSTIGQQAYVQNTSFDHNGSSGVLLSAGGSVTIVDSSADRNGYGFTVVNGNLTLVGDRVMFNTTGLFLVSAAASVNIAYCLVTQNTTPFDIESGGSLAGTNPGTNLVTGTGIGTPATPKNLM